MQVYIILVSSQWKFSNFNYYLFHEMSMFLYEEHDGVSGLDLDALLLLMDR